MDAAVKKEARAHAMQSSRRDSAAAAAREVNRFSGPKSLHGGGGARAGKHDLLLAPAEVRSDGANCSKGQSKAAVLDCIQPCEEGAHVAHDHESSAHVDLPVPKGLIRVEVLDLLPAMRNPEKEGNGGNGEAEDDVGGETHGLLPLPCNGDHFGHQAHKEARDSAVLASHQAADGRDDEDVENAHGSVLSANKKVSDELAKLGQLDEGIGGDVPEGVHGLGLVGDWWEFTAMAGFRFLNHTCHGRNSHESFKRSGRHRGNTCGLDQLRDGLDEVNAAPQLDSRDSHVQDLSCPTGSSCCELGSASWVSAAWYALMTLTAAATIKASPFSTLSCAAINAALMADNSASAVPWGVFDIQFSNWVDWLRRGGLGLCGLGGGRKLLAARSSGLKWRSNSPLPKERTMEISNETYAMTGQFEAGPVYEAQGVMLRLQYVDLPGQTRDQAKTSRPYLMSPDLAKAVIAALQKSLRDLDAGPSQSGTTLSH